MIVGALSHRTSIREVAYLSNVQQKLLFKGFSTVLSAGKLCLIMQVVAISDYSLLGLNEDWYKTTEGWLSIKQILIWHPLKWSLTAHCIMWDMEGIFEHLCRVQLNKKECHKIWQKLMIIQIPSCNRRWQSENLMEMAQTHGPHMYECNPSSFWGLFPWHNFGQSINVEHLNSVTCLRI